MMPQHYRLIIIEPFDTASDIVAIQVTNESAKRAALFCNGVETEEIDALDGTKRFAAVNVATSEGPKRASEGSWIVKYPSGEFGVFPDHIFKKQFRLVQPGEE